MYTIVTYYSSIFYLPQVNMLYSSWYLSCLLLQEHLWSIAEPLKRQSELYWQHYMKYLKIKTLTVVNMQGMAGQLVLLLYF